MEPVRTAPGSVRLDVLLLRAGLLAAAGWMVFRIFVGVDFTDEMQYYGEIASLVRTGKLFQSDLFAQQLGYVFLVPFFKLHAAVFPGLDWLFLSGRLLLFAGYLVTAWLIARVLRGEPPVARLAALALHFSWIPFQLFAPSYNTMAHLLMVGLAAAWLRLAAGPVPAGWRIGFAAGLAVLGFVHPPAGLVMAAAYAWLLGRRAGWAEPVRLAAWTVGAAGVILAGIRWWHGPDFFADLQVVVEFSRAHSVASTVLHSSQWPGLLALAAAAALFLVVQGVWRRGGRLFAAGPRVVVWVLALLVFVVTGRALWSEGGWLGYAPDAVVLLLLLVLAVWLGEARAAGHPAGRRLSWLAAVALGAFGLLCVRETMLWGTGFFALAAFAALLAALAAQGRVLPGCGDLALLGLAGGTLFAGTSGNGLHNFGVGCASVLPFLIARLAAALEAQRVRHTHVLLPLVLLPALMLVQGMRQPYREERGLAGFAWIEGVPALRGLQTTPDKRQALAVYRTLQGGLDVSGKRLLVIGPQPWIYFASGAVPATPMFFMHFDGIPAVDRILAERLFQAGEPDFVVVTCPVPPELYPPIQEWLGRGSTMVHLPLPQPFKSRYELLTGYILGDSLMLFQKVPAQP